MGEFKSKMKISWQVRPTLSAYWGMQTRKPSSLKEKMTTSTRHLAGVKQGSVFKIQILEELCCPSEPAVQLCYWCWCDCRAPATRCCPWPCPAPIPLSNSQTGWWPACPTPGLSWRWVGSTTTSHFHVKLICQVVHRLHGLLLLVAVPGSLGLQHLLPLVLKLDSNPLNTRGPGDDSGPSATFWADPAAAWRARPPLPGTVANGHGQRPRKQQKDLLQTPSTKFTLFMQPSCLSVICLFNSFLWVEVLLYWSHKFGRSDKFILSMMITQLSGEESEDAGLFGGTGVWLCTGGRSLGIIHCYYCFWYSGACWLFIW